MTKAQSIIDKGDFESYDTLEELVRGALQVGETDKGTTDVFLTLMRLWMMITDTLFQLEYLVLTTC